MMTEEYGSPEWTAEIEDRHLADLVEQSGALRKLSQKYGVLDDQGKPTGKILTDEERQGLMAEADAVGEKTANDAEFEESKHPRDEEGKFSHVAASAAGEGGKRTSAEGKPLPPHIASIRIPPAWTDVTYAESPDASLLVTGKDVKGRQQVIYSLAHNQKAAAAKFARVKEMAAKFENMRAQNEKSRLDPKLKDTADCLALIMDTGIRPGSTSDTGGAAKAYGATTLRGYHVTGEEGNKLRLKFVGKKGINLSIPITEPGLVAMLKERASKAGRGPLFPETSDKKLLEHVHSLDGGGFKTKDFRTYIGTSLASNLVAAHRVPKDAKAYKKAVREIAKAVSQKLGNTPTIALQSYINPVVFAAWKGSLTSTSKTKKK